MRQFSTKVDYGLCFFLALALLVVPLEWILCTVAAAAVHELFHILAIWGMGEEITNFQIGLSGAVLHTASISLKKTLVATLAGPLGSLMLLHFLHLYPKLAICGGVQGLFNLLPIYPLDGGRALYCALSMLLPENHAKRTMTHIQWTSITFLTALCIYFSIILQTGLLLLVSTLLWRVLPRKISCKPK